jgi:hypothetical protein
MIRAAASVMMSRIEHMFDPVKSSLPPRLDPGRRRGAARAEQLGQAIMT